MKKIKFILIVWFFMPIFASGQDLSQLELKHPITEKDHGNLLNYLRKSFTPEGSMLYEFSNVGLSEELPAQGDIKYTLDDLKEIQLKLKKDSANVNLLLGAGNISKTLNFPKTAEKYYYEALEIVAQSIKKDKQNAGLYQMAGNIYSGINDYPMMIMSYEKAFDLDSTRDTISSVMLPFAYMGAGFYIKLKEHCALLAKKNPDDLPTNLFYLWGQLFQRFSEGFDFGPKSPETFFAQYSIFNDIDSTYLNTALKRNPESLPFLQMVHGFEIYGLLLEVLNTYDYSNNKLKLTENSKLKVVEHQKFFQEIIKKKKTKNLFFPYYSLGFLDLLLEKNKSAINYFEKAIKEFPVDKTAKQFNPASAYSNIIYAYLVSKDTISAEKKLNEKMEILPALYPDPNDYFAKTCFRIYHHDLAAVEENIAKCKSVDSNFVTIETASVYLHLTKKEYKKAQEILEKNYSFMKDDYQYNLLYATLLLLQNDAGSAKVFLAKSVSLAPESKILNRMIDEYFKIP